MHINGLCGVSPDWSKSRNTRLQDDVYTIHNKYDMPNVMSIFVNRYLDGNDDDVAGKDTSNLKISLKDLGAALTPKRRLNMFAVSMATVRCCRGCGGVRTQ